MNECEMCLNFTYDEEIDDWECDAYMDEDDMARIMQDHRAHCPYWRTNDEYRTVKHQAIGHLPGYSDQGYFPEREEKHYEGER